MAGLSTTLFAALSDKRPRRMSNQPLKLTFKVTREPWTDFFKIYLVDLNTGIPNGQSEELDVDETFEWFKARGSDIPLLERALDHIWNFYKGTVTIKVYKEPPIRNPQVEPKVD